MPQKKNLDENLIVHLYVDKEQSVKDIATKLGVSPATIQRRLRKRGVLRSNQKKRKVTNEQLYDLYINQNMTMQQIADYLGISASTVQQNLKFAGIEKDEGEIRRTYERTMLDRYGDTIPIRVDEINKKIKKTNQQRYGADSPFESPDIFAKTQQTLCDRYGVANAGQLRKSKLFEEEHVKDLEDLLDSGTSTNKPQRPSKQHTIAHKASNKCKSKNPFPFDIVPTFEQILTEEYLYHAFIEQNKSRKEIAAEVGCSEATVKKYLRKFHIIKDRSQTQKKIEETNLQKYGVKTNMSTPQFKEQSRISSLEKYGTEHPSQSEEVRRKFQQTSLERYGTKNPASSDYVRKKLSDIMSDPARIDKIKKQRIKCYQEKYGENVTHQSLRHVHHLDKWIDFEDWCHQQHAKTGEKIDKVQAADFFNVTIGTLQKKIRETGTASLFSISVSQGEFLICKWLDEQKIEYVLHDRQMLHPKEIDIFIPQCALGIEINPTASHNSDICVYAPDNGKPKSKTYHQDKTRAAIKQGIKLIHVFDWTNIDTIKSEIFREVFGETIPFASKNDVKYEVVTTHNGKITCDVFIDSNHIITISGKTDINDNDTPVLRITSCKQNKHYNVDGPVDLAQGIARASALPFGIIIFESDGNMGVPSIVRSCVDKCQLVFHEPNVMWGNAYYAEDNRCFHSDPHDDRFCRVYDAGRIDYIFSIES